MEAWLTKLLHDRPAEQRCRRVVLAVGRDPIDGPATPGTWPGIRCIGSIAGDADHHLPGLGHIPLPPSSVLVLAPGRAVTAGERPATMLNTLLAATSLAHRHFRRRGGRGRNRLEIRPWDGWASACALLAELRRLPDGPHATPYAVGLVRCLLALGVEAADATPPVASDRLVRAAEDAIDELLPAALDRRTVAASLGVHPGHLSRVVSRESGHGVGELILRRRFALLDVLYRNDPSRGIGATALAAGFSSAALCNQACRRLYGQTPREWLAVSGLRVSVG